MQPARTPPHIVTLTLATALSVLSLNMFLPSLANIAAEFQVEYGVVNLSIAGFLGISAALQLIMGPLSDRFGRRPVTWCAFAIFAVASLGAAFASDVWTFLGFRMLQAAVVAGQVLSRATIRDMYSPAEAASKLGYVSMAMALAPMLGPMLGGFLDMWFGWRAGFVLYTLLGAGMLALTHIDWGETNTRKSATFGAQLRSYPGLFTARRFWGYSLCVAFSVGSFFAFITGTPLVAAAWFDLSPALVGLGIGIITWGFMAGNFVTGKLAGRLDLLTLIIAGRISATIGPIFGLSMFLLGQGSVWIFFGSAILVGIGNGLSVANANAGLMSVRPHLAGSASGLSGALTVAVGAVLTSLTGVMVTPENAPMMVMGIILCCSLIALGSALYVRWLNLRDPLPA